jgi:hypothetical protein
MRHRTVSGGSASDDAESSSTVQDPADESSERAIQVTIGLQPVRVNVTEEKFMIALPFQPVGE